MNIYSFVVSALWHPTLELPQLDKLHTEKGNLKILSHQRSLLQVQLWGFPITLIERAAIR